MNLKSLMIAACALPLNLHAAPLYYISGEVVANAFPDDINNTPSTTIQLQAVSHNDSMVANSSAGNFGLARYDANHANALVRAEVYAENALFTTDVYHWANAAGFVHLVDTLTFTVPAGNYANGVSVTASGQYDLFMEATGRGQARGTFEASLGANFFTTGVLEVAGQGGIDTLSISDPFSVGLQLVAPGSNLTTPLVRSETISLCFGCSASLVAGTQSIPAEPLSATGRFDGFNSAFYTSLDISEANVTWESASGTFLSAPVPLPAAFWLFGSGLIGLIAIARRNKAA